jgi:ribosomal protein S6--L-glutamate ligase
LDAFLEKEMHFCFIIEAEYRHELMPMVIAQKLMQWGHEVDLLEPSMTITSLKEMAEARYDAYVLKTVSDGPGLSILEAAEAAGIPTINHSRAIRLVRDKAIATTRAIAYKLPVPQTYFVAHPGLLGQVPADDYPLVIKPTNGSSCRAIYKVNSSQDLAMLDLDGAGSRFFLAQHYVENSGYDVKLYVAGTQVFAVAKRSPLHPDVEVDKHLMPISLELRELALRVGEIFGLDIYGLDIVETSSGPMVVDINDFPSFGRVPEAINLVATHIIDIAAQRLRQRLNHSIYGRVPILSNDAVASA